MSYVMSKYIKQLLNEIEQEMQRLALWQTLPPNPDAFLSEQPFSIDTMTASEWLQWVFLPRMNALIEGNFDIPRNFVLYPYFEEALQEQSAITLLCLIKQLDEYVKK